MLSEVDLSGGSDAFDEDNITKQLHADLQQQAGTYSEKHSKRDKKRKSRDAGEGARSGTDDTPRKKRKKKQAERVRKGAEFPSDASSQIFKNPKDGFALKPEVHLRSLKLEQGLVETSIPQTAHRKDRSVTHMENLTGGKTKRGRTDFTNTSHDLKPSTAPGRFSLGSNRDALLQSILKDCSPDRLKQLEALESADTVSDTESDIPTPEITTVAQDKTKQPLGPKPACAEILANSKLNATSSPKAAKFTHNAHASLKAQSRPKGYMIPMLPTGYKAGAESSKKEYHCPVEGCDKLYTRKTRLGEHMNVSISKHHTSILHGF
jgi:hypothetical protein